MTELISFDPLALPEDLENIYPGHPKWTVENLQKSFYMIFSSLLKFINPPYFEIDAFNAYNQFNIAVFNDEDLLFLETCKDIEQIARLISEKLSIMFARTKTWEEANALLALIKLKTHEDPSQFFD